jgi:hypothetical protein
MRFWKPRKIAGTPKVGVAVAAYIGGDERLAASLEGLAASIRAQTYPHWCMLVVHDGPSDGLIGDRTLGRISLPEPRCLTHETVVRKQQFGHPHRQMAIDRLLELGCEWIGLTNQDNYYVPVYLEWMLATAQDKQAELVYCDAVHSHKQWKPLSGELRRGHIDLGGFLVHKRIAEKIKFDKFTFAGDWDYISRLKAATKKTCKVPGTLFIHN